MSKEMRYILTTAKVVLPLALLAVCIVAARWLILAKEPAAKKEVREPVTLIEVVTADLGSVRPIIRSQGTVAPRTETTLVARVAGRIEKLAEAVNGTGFVRAGEELVWIDKRDHEARIDRLEASLLGAEASSAETQQQHKRHLTLFDKGAFTQSSLDQSTATRDVASANVDVLKAQLDEARNSLADTVVVAPFDGYINEKRVDVGQYVTPGTPLAVSFATDAVEIRLPITDVEFRFLEIPLGGNLETSRQPKVTLDAQFGGQRHRWMGSIVRSEPRIDPRSRMVYLVARVEDPYRPSLGGQGQPLAVGMFVDARIEAPAIEGVSVLPDQAVDSEGRILVVGSDERLEVRHVEVLQRNRGRAMVRGDLTAGERICKTPLDNPVPGMLVQVTGKESIALAMDPVADNVEQM